MMKSIEERLIESHNSDIQKQELRRLFDLYTSAPDDLVNALGIAQKNCGSDVQGWMDYVIDVMAGMELHDAGFFPAEWFPPEP
jgi:hypothetical protein